MEFKTSVIIAVMQAREQELRALRGARSAVPTPWGKDVPPIVNTAIAKPSGSLSKAEGVGKRILSCSSIESNNLLTRKDVGD
jgi:hypothetical protein